MLYLWWPITPEDTRPCRQARRGPCWSWSGALPPGPGTTGPRAPRSPSLAATEPGCGRVESTLRASTLPRPTHRILKQIHIIQIDIWEKKYGYNIINLREFTLWSCLTYNLGVSSSKAGRAKYLWQTIWRVRCNELRERSSSLLQVDSITYLLILWRSHGWHDKCHGCLDKSL